MLLDDVKSSAATLKRYRQNAIDRGNDTAMADVELIMRTLQKLVDEVYKGAHN